MGGLLKYVTRVPSLSEAQLRIGADGSSIEGAGDAGWAARASVDLPLITDVLALGASVFRQVTPGYIDNAMTGERNENRVVQEGASFVALWRPNDDLSIKLTSIFQDVDAANGATVTLSPLTRQPLFGDLLSAHLLPQPSSQQLRYYSATVNWNLQWADFVSASSYSRLNTENRQDLSGSLGGIFPDVSAAFPEYTNGVVVPPGLAPFIGIVGE